MNYKKKICVVTGTRAEYGLLRYLIQAIANAECLELQLIVTGMHLSPEFGLTYREIEKDGFTINSKIEMLLSSDTDIGITKSMGLAMISFADAFADLQPDLLLVLGDRFETFSAVSAATICKIPIAHMYGGETTEGAYDESFRHSISKMSHLHFTSTELYRKRVIQLGEYPDRVFNVGAIGIDNIKKIKLLTREEFEISIGFQLNQHNLLITFHPVTLEKQTSAQQFESLLTVLDQQKNTHLIFTKANADSDGRIINKMIDMYVKEHSDRAVAYTSLGQLRYLSAMQYVDGVVGNSSSGIIEAPSFKIGTINIGDRQKGRIRAESIIDCEPTVASINMAIDMLYSDKFKRRLEHISNPYGEGNTTERVMDIICNYDLSGILKKQFYDIEVKV